MKVWDIKRANPHVKDLAQVNAQIMCGEFSPAKDMLLIGDASGTATILSTKGNLDTPPTMIPYDTTNDEEFEQQENEDDVPDDQKARYYARELLKSGKVGLRDGKCGYGVYKIK